ncbi:Peroxisomal biogenesis factor 6 [Podosphaera aphanis]|nr:Peroxisomal biogenesis factor 6 [Podosphaera aphanis]
MLLNHTILRRRGEKPALKARLVFSDNLTGEAAVLSADLFTQLFPTAVAQENTNARQTSDFRDLHVALASCETSPQAEDATWSIVPIKHPSENTLPNSTIQISSTPTNLQFFTENTTKLLPTKWQSPKRSGSHIWVLDVVPMPLKTVFLSIDKHTTSGEERREDSDSTGTGSQGALQNKNSASTESLIVSTRKALSTVRIIHTGDEIPLNLQSQSDTPITAKVSYCAPVGQGILSPNTSIIIKQARKKVPRRRSPEKTTTQLISDSVLEEDEVASNDQFFSATEDRDKPDLSTEGYESATETETDTSIVDTDELSDDSMEDVISLPFPMLSPQDPSGLSTMPLGTPHIIGTGLRNNGISTPGSVFSTLTSMTARRTESRGSLFKTQPLIRPLAEDIFYPKPNFDDDREARVYVNINALAKIGCFSGDWVKLTVATKPAAQGSGLWAVQGPELISQSEDLWRPVKVYGLPESYSGHPLPKMTSRREGGRKTSSFQSQESQLMCLTVYLSPILLANMENTQYCRISVLKQIHPLGNNLPPKPASTSRPPIARDLGLVKISTPLSTERSLQNVLFAGLQRYFASKMRIVKKGDLIAIGIDRNLGQTLYRPGVSEDAEIDDVISNIGKPTGVAWFRVNHVGNLRDVDEPKEEDNMWGEVVSVDPTSTRISQSGSENCRLPGNLENPWEYYLGLKTFPNMENHRGSIPKLRQFRESNLQRRLRELIAAATDLRTIHLQPKPLAILLFSTQRNIGKATMAQRAFTNLGLHFFEIHAYDIVSGEVPGSDVKTAGLLEARAERAMACGPEYCGLLIRHIEVLSTDRMTASLKKILEATRIFVATTSEVDKVPDDVRSLFTHELEMTAPNEAERECILRDIIDNQSVPSAPDVELASISVKTAALVAGDLVDVVNRALVARTIRLEKLVSSSDLAHKNVTLRDLLLAGGDLVKCLIKADFDYAVDAARKNFADAIGAPKIPNVTWKDVGGLENVKDAVMETIELPLERPELFANGMKKRSGILFYGPPGTGKTLLAKAIATEFSLNFFSVKGPELLNMYIGESEANVRRVFQRARDARPCVVFFDELDSVAPKRGNQGDSGGVMDRIVSQLLAELDGMSDGDDGGGGVFVIGATNRPDLLDAALLRPGRFDKMLYLGVSDTHEKQLTILEALTRKFPLHPDLSLEHLASKLPFTYTGADFYALCSDAMLKAAIRQSSLVDAKVSEINASNARQGKDSITTAYYFDHYATKEDVAVMVIEDDFWAAMGELIPSVSVKELENYKRVRDQFDQSDNTEKKNALHSGTGKGKDAVRDKFASAEPLREEAIISPAHEKLTGLVHEVDRKGKGKAIIRYDPDSDADG